MEKDRKKEFITEDIKDSLKETFRELKETVPVEVYTKMGVNDMFNELTIELTKAISEVTDKVKVGYFRIGDEDSRKRNVQRSPTILIAPDKYDIRYTGAPLGEEGRSFIMALILISTGQTLLSDDSRKRLNRLKDKRHVRVFVSPT